MLPQTGAALPHQAAMPVEVRQVRLEQDCSDVAMYRFLAAENLPATYKEQVVQFILQNSSGAAGAPATQTPSVDPFTGGAAYVPGGSSSTSVTGGGFDPFTGKPWLLCQLETWCWLHLPCACMLVPSGWTSLHAGDHVPGLPVYVRPAICHAIPYVLAGDCMLCHAPA